jgi:hypothetical protein
VSAADAPTLEEIERHLRRALDEGHHENLVAGAGMALGAAVRFKVERDKARARVAELEAEKDVGLTAELSRELLALIAERVGFGVSTHPIAAIEDLVRGCEHWHELFAGMTRERDEARRERDEHQRAAVDALSEVDRLRSALVNAENGEGCAKAERDEARAEVEPLRAACADAASAMEWQQKLMAEAEVERHRLATMVDEAVDLMRQARLAWGSLMPPRWRDQAATFIAKHDAKPATLVVETVDYFVQLLEPPAPGTLIRRAAVIREARASERLDGETYGEAEARALTRDCPKCGAPTSVWCSKSPRGEYLVCEERRVRAGEDDDGDPA